MAVYYKFKSAKDYDSIAMDGPFISVGTLKDKIFESKHLGKGTDFDLLLTNAQSNQEYLDEEMLIPKNSSVLIRRVPGRPRNPIVTDPNPKVEENVEYVEPERTSYQTAVSSTMNYPDDSEWDDLGADLYEIPDAPQVQRINVISEAPPTNTADEDSKIKALIDTPALDWQRQGGSDGFGQGRGFGRGMGGRMGVNGFRGPGLERRTPPQGYICHRCKVPGHFIQHCPTNGDPKFEVKRVKPPTGIPKSMLMATSDGSYALPSGAVAVLRPNEAAFEREIEGIPSTRSVGDLPPELHCPLCKEVMKDAVLTSKCCFNSFCDKCIRDYIISRSICVCGATNVLADDLLPNKTLRDTISRILESGTSSADNAGSAYHVQDMESARFVQQKVPSPAMSAASKGEGTSLPFNEETPKVHEIASAEVKPVLVAEQQVENRINTIPDVSEATHDSVSVKEPASQGSALLVDEEVQQRLASSEAAKKKKKKKLPRPTPTNDLQWNGPPNVPVENYMMPMGVGPAPYNPYWGGGMQPGMDAYMPQFSQPMPPPYMSGYNMGPQDMPFGGGFMPPHDPYANQGYMFPAMPPQRGPMEFNMPMNFPPPAMSREEFEARKADSRRKREMERRVDSREFPRDQEFNREVSSGGNNGPMMKPKSRPLERPPSPEYHRRHHRPERSTSERSHSRDLDPPSRSLKRKTDHHHHHQHRSDHRHHRSESSSRPSAPESSRKSPSPAQVAASDAHKASSVFSRISFPEGGESKSKKRSKVSSSSRHHQDDYEDVDDDHNNDEDKIMTTTNSASESVGAWKSRSSAEYDSSEDEEDRHFKRKPSRYEPSPPRQHSRRDSRERDHGQKKLNRIHV